MEKQETETEAETDMEKRIRPLPDQYFAQISDL